MKWIVFSVNLCASSVFSVVRVKKGLNHTEHRGSTERPCKESILTCSPLTTRARTAKLDANAPSR
jgi:hypothetical protein